MTTRQVSLRIDNDLYNKVSTLFNKLGLSISDATRIFFTKAVNDNGLPFELKLDYEPNEETKKAMFSDDRIEVKSINELWEQYENN